ncbi:MAG: serine--tRNA ligase [Nanoarchaeota archaeon]|nr:serine--tRNA ligase [Nanoarchaeota archaeon]MBU1270200.1 serine--tRNA ligase [Nanoarchaeota archaeon]MBU1604616.1 serine--tRNA ligase [Nanoarchaeota archaeon]MBU2443550.1 serine--tRNA ligase [Nanoarchaeota archaeon]
MIDLKLVRENPELVKKNIKNKFQGAKLPLVDKLVEMDKEERRLKVEAEQLRHKRNSLSLSISEVKKKKGDASKLLSEAKNIPQKIAKIEEKQKALQDDIRTIMLTIPNIIHESVKIGKDHTQNVEIKKIGTPKKFDFEVKSHVEIAEKLGLGDFETSAETSGNGFYFLKGDLALLNVALINFARDYMVKQGYLYIETPLMIREKVLNGVFSNEEIEVMTYRIRDEDLNLIATSEHSLIGSFINKTIEEKDIPIKLTSYSMCFRREIGSHGIDEKGLFRTHQFNKQEMVVISKPKDSYKFYDEMLNHSVEVFKQLGIPTRILECCSGDLADLKTKSADLEAWSPRKKEYFEICSVSNLSDAQSRRLNIRVKGKEGNYFPHTLNNTVIATSRAMVAILENYQNKDGSVDIPKALQPYMSGKKKLTKI